MGEPSARQTALGTSHPVEPRWRDGASPAEQQLWHWAVEQLPDRVRVLPSVTMTMTMTMTRPGRPDECELDLVLVDPEHGITIVEVKGGRIACHRHTAAWKQNDHDVRDPVEQAKRGRSILRRALDDLGLDTRQVALRWVVATPECTLDAPGVPVLPPRSCGTRAPPTTSISGSHLCSPAWSTATPLSPLSTAVARHESHRVRRGPCRGARVGGEPRC